jgi:transposase InsO family protein
MRLRRLLGHTQERAPRGLDYNRAHARSVIFEYIENFYNGRRRHSSIAYRSPREHEALYTMETKPA